MVEYTDDQGELEGLDWDDTPIRDLLPPPEILKRAPIEVTRALPDGTEEVVLYRKTTGKKVHAVRLSDRGDIELEMDDGFILALEAEKDIQGIIKEEK